MLDQTHINNLVELIGIDNIKFDELAKRFDPGMSAENLGADIVASPTSTAEVSSLIEYCNDQNLSVVPQGGRTGLSGAAESEPGELIFDMQKMNQIIDIDFASGVATVEARVN